MSVICEHLINGSQGEGKIGLGSLETQKKRGLDHMGKNKVRVDNRSETELQIGRKGWAKFLPREQGEGSTN